MGWFSKKFKKTEVQERLNQCEVQLENALSEIETLNLEVKRERDKLQNVEQLLKQTRDNYLQALPSGQQGTLFKKLLIEFKEGNGVESKKLELSKLRCQEMYLADRNSMIYELVNTIVISDLTISNSHFEKACFDTVIFCNVVFNNIIFYKAFFEDVRFISCTFNQCDFTCAKGFGVKFEDCIFHETDITTMELQNKVDEDC